MTKEGAEEESAVTGRLGRFQRRFGEGGQGGVGSVGAEGFEWMEEGVQSQAVVGENGAKGKGKKA